MTVSYQIVGTVVWVTLFDQSKGASTLMPTFKPEFTFLVQTAPGFGATSQSITPQSNVLVRCQFTFQIIYASLQLAVASVRLLRNALGGKRFHLQVNQDGETQYYLNGTVESFSPDVSGAAVDHVFVFKTQDIQAAAPSNLQSNLNV